MAKAKHPSLFPGDVDVAMQTVKFHGSELDEQRDAKDLTLQFQAVHNVMSDGQWRTDEQLEAAVRERYPDVPCKSTSIARQRRYQDELDEWHVEHKYIGKRLWTHRLVREE